MNNSSYNNNTFDSIHNNADHSEPLLNQAQAAIDNLNSLLNSSSACLDRKVSTELLQDLLMILPSRQERKACRSL